MCKKPKLNVSVNENTYHSPNQVIQQNKIELNNKFNLETIQKIYKNLQQKMSLIIMMSLMTPPMFLMIISL